MNPLRCLLTLPTVLVATVAVAAAPSMDAKRGRERVVLAASPDLADPMIAAQRRILSDWRQGGEERDVTLVTVAGSRVAGTGDTASALRKRYALPSDRFEVLLIGKDGHVAVRSPEPIAADTLQRTIDAMPMRRTGQR